MSFIHFQTAIIIKVIFYWIGLGTINGQLKHGFGVYKYCNGDIYEGNWVND